MTDERLSFPVSTTSRLVEQTFTRFDSQYGLLALSEFAVGPEAIPACGEVFRSIALHYIGFVAHRHCALPTGKNTACRLIPCLGRRLNGISRPPRNWVSRALACGCRGRA